MFVIILCQALGPWRQSKTGVNEGGRGQAKNGGSLGRGLPLFFARSRSPAFRSSLQTESQPTDKLFFVQFLKAYNCCC